MIPHNFTYVLKCCGWPKKSDLAQEQSFPISHLEQFFSYLTIVLLYLTLYDYYLTDPHQKNMSDDIAAWIRHPNRMVTSTKMDRRYE